MLRPSSFYACAAVSVLTLLLAVPLVSALDAPALAAPPLEEAASRGGVLVVVGVPPAEQLDTITTAHQGLVQILDTQGGSKADALRRRLIEAGDYGRITVTSGTKAGQAAPTRLPYIDNYVNSLVVFDKMELDESEIQRVLCPGGVAYFRDGDGWTRIEKPRPATIDQWTHYLYDSSNNAVSHDKVVGPPRHMQWIAGPRYSRHHDRMSSFSAAVSAEGRLFYIIDEAQPVSILAPPRWKVVARDAFNGVVLWERPLENWHTHLWPLKSGPAQLPRRLVAVDDRVYVTLALDDPVTVLDAKSGEIIRRLEPTKATEEILVHGDDVLALVDPDAAAPAPTDPKEFGGGYGRPYWDESPRTILLVDGESGDVRWRHEARVLPVTLAMDADSVIYHNGESVVCLDRASGSERWRSEPVPRSEKILGYFAPTLVLHDGVVLFAGGETAGAQTGSWYETGKDTMTALDSETGKVLWTAHHPPSGYRSPEDLLVAGGLVWTGETTSGRSVGLFTGRDLRTGQVRSEFAPDVDTYWFHHRCYRGKATDDYLLMSRTGIEFLDLDEQTWTPHHWVRGACLYGILPANGLVYAPQHPCACYLEAKMSGLTALAPAAGASRDALTPNDSERLIRGPAFDRTSTAAAAPDDWPTYRGDAKRSGRARTIVPDQLTTLWKNDIGGRLSAPIVADNTVFVAAVDTHTIQAVDIATGSTKWTFTTGGRIDSPPTYRQGRIYFGSADGHVYCVDATDGTVVWRFLAAPIDQRLTSMSQIESVWPVHGSVLIYNDDLYFVAGRSMFVDGGLVLWRLDPATGAVRSKTELNEKDALSGKDLQDFVTWLNMPTALPDVLSCDGKYIYMRSQPFSLDGERLPLKPFPWTGNPDKGAPPPVQHQEYAHIFSPTGFLDDSWWHRTYWIYGSRFVSGWCGYYLAGKAAPAGRILVHDDDTVFGFGRKPQYYRWTTPIEHQLFAAGTTLPELGPEYQENPQGAKYAVEHRWTQDLPLMARGMVLTDDALFVAGPPDFVEEDDALRSIGRAETLDLLSGQAAALSGDRGGILHGISPADGSRRLEIELDAPPVFDGLIAARKRLILCATDGHVQCLGSQ